MKFQDLSIKRKLILMTMLTSSIALLLSSVSFLIYDLISFRNLLTHDLATQAQIIGYNSAAAMAFKDEPAATATLSALTAKSDIVSAALYSPNGQMFAHYFRDKQTLPNAVPICSPENSYRFEGQFLEVCHEVTLNGDRVGTLLLQSDMSQWSMRARRYATICLVFALVSVFFAFLVSSKLQKVISGPIMHLEDTMKMVSANKNYEVRAVKSYSDEIGSLIDGFNAMLSDIQQRDGALRGANDELQTRTLELEEEVSQRKQAQEELLNAKHVAEEASRAKSTFLANMSHELRTPLNAIIGYSEMLEEEARDSEKAEDIRDLQKIQFAGKHLLSLINDVLDLSKIEAGKMPLHLETFDVRPMVSEIITTLQPAIEKNKNTLRVRVADEVSAMRADVTKVRQILFNLLSNACKFTDHGTIGLDVDRKLEGGQDWIRFQVSDTGIGIAAKQRDNLFKEFAQADTSIARKYGGTGLGLAISYKFVQLMKGRIGVESELGKGATFTAELPVNVRTETADSPRPDGASDSPAAASPTKTDRDTILVIDDDAAVRELMSRFLSKLDLNVVSARSGEEGLRLAAQLHPVIITLDVVMPERDGWSVLNQLKADPELSEIPVIMVTIVDNEAMGINLGASNYLVKPVHRERLADLIEQYRLVRSSAPKTIKMPVSLSPTRKGQERSEAENPRRR
ncbi:MAG: Cache sensor hybrid histidine kinase [Acidobacteriaceae bacterium]|nr:Cache sensor hybrid histidine kinase [Acidobacteriaceae bacterium]